MHRSVLSPPGRAGRWLLAIGLVTATGVAAAAPAASATSAHTSTHSWQSYVLGPSADQVTAVRVESRGAVTHPESLLRSHGKATTLTTAAGKTPASVLLDFGKDIAGTPYLDVTKASGPVTLNLVTSEARQYIRQPANTTVAVAADTGAAQVTLASANGLENGNTITLGTQVRTITGFDPTARTVTLDRPLDQALATGTAVTSSPGAPASDESRGLAGVGGPDNLAVSAAGRVAGGYHGGFRFVLVTLTSPGSVTISGAGVDFQGYRATPSDYRGWFLSSDDELNRMWYSGAYTLQLNLKPGGLNSLPDARIYDGAKRDRSIWTGDLLVQGPTAISTLGDDGAAYLKSSLNVLFASQRADGALPGSPDFRKGRNPPGRRCSTRTTTRVTGHGRPSTITATPATGRTSKACCRISVASWRTTTPSGMRTIW